MKLHATIETIMKSKTTPQERYEREGNHHIGETMAAYCHLIGIPGHWAVRIRNYDGARHWYFHCYLHDSEMRAIRYAWSTEDMPKIVAFIEEGKTGKLETDFAIYEVKEDHYPITRVSQVLRHGIRHVERASGLFPVHGQLENALAK